MKLKHIFFTTTALFILNGCFSASNFYVLSVASQPQSTYVSNHRSIGVEKVTIPAYMFKRQIAFAKSPSQIAYMSSAEWGEDLDEGLTNRLISFLQKKFSEPRVYQYPWQTDTPPYKKVKLQITRFIAYGDRVYLDANWEIETLATGKRRSRLFSTSVATKAGSAASIVASMDAAFRQLEESVASGLR